MSDPFAGLPRHHFAAILADPPWGFQCWNGHDKRVAARGSSTPYRTMSMDQIAELRVSELAARDSCLFLWVVWPTLPGALAVMDAWGFKYKTCAFAWTKGDARQSEFFRDDVTPSMGLGYWTRANSEMCLLGTRGAPKRLGAGIRQAVIEPRRQHSRKPDCVYGRIERLVAGPYLELFARNTRPGWTSWGNETSKFGEVA